MWVVLGLTMTKLVFGQLVLFETEFSPQRSALWNALARPVWSLGVCFILVSCSTGSGGINELFFPKKTDYCFQVVSTIFCRTLYFEFWVN